MDLRLILGFAWPWRGTLALCVVLMLAETGAALALPWLAGQFAGGLLTGAPQTGGLLLAGLLLIVGLQAVLQFGNRWLGGRAAESILADLRMRLYDHLQALPLAYFQQRRHGEVLALLTNDVAHLSGYISGTLLSVVPLALTVSGAAIMLLRIDARLAAVVLVMIPVFYLLLKIMGRRLRPLSSQLQQAHADAVAIAEENLAMLPAIKTHTREPLESARYGAKIRSILHLSNQERLIDAALGPGVQFLAAAALVLILWQLGSPTAGRSPAEMVSFLLYAALLTRPVSGLADVYGQTRQARGALERLGTVLAEPPARLGGFLQCRGLVDQPVGLAQFEDFLLPPELGREVVVDLAERSLEHSAHREFDLQGAHPFARRIDRANPGADGASAVARRALAGRSVVRVFRGQERGVRDLEADAIALGEPLHADALAGHDLLLHPGLVEPHQVHPPGLVYQHRLEPRAPAPGESAAGDLRRRDLTARADDRSFLQSGDRRFGLDALVPHRQVADQIGDRADFKPLQTFGDLRADRPHLTQRGEQERPARLVLAPVRRRLIRG